MRNSVDWTTVDWCQQDVVLAKQLERTRERVRQARKRFGGQQPEGYRRRTSGSIRLRLAKTATEVMTLPKLSKHAGRKSETIRCVLKKMGKGYKRMPNGNARYDWSRFPAGWRAMTDKDIGAIVGAGNPAIVAQWRNRHGYRKNAA